MFCVKVVLYMRNFFRKVFPYWVSLCVRSSAIEAEVSAIRRESGGIGRRTGLRIRRGNLWGFESPLSHHLKRHVVSPMEGRPMQRMIIVAAVLTTLVLAPWVCQAQYYSSYGYGYYYPYTYQPPTYYPRSAPPNQAPANTFYRRWSPDPRMMRKWDRHNRWSEYENQFRSPNNPESALDYMLRTF